MWWHNNYYFADASDNITLCQYYDHLTIQGPVWNTPPPHAADHVPGLCLWAFAMYVESPYSLITWPGFPGHAHWRHGLETRKSSVTWRQYWHHRVKRVQFKSIRHFLSGIIVKSLYNSLILPYLMYCNIVWCSSYPTHLSKLFILRKRSIRIITNSILMFYFAVVKILNVSYILNCW